MSERTQREGMVMVCVTIQRSCERLIRAGDTLAKKHELPLTVVHVARERETFLGNLDEGEALDVLFALSSAVNAKMQVLRSDQVMQSLVTFARDNGVSHMVMGASRDGKGVHSLIQEIRVQLPGVIFQIIPDE
ncbi:MAG: universal stress protein UspA [Christensenellales bacterium]|jgi:K+-sensing histidine kinase KdpD